MEKKYHYIYKTTCIITGKFYVGMHSTDTLEDGYLGSGKRLRYSIKKYGVENHKKDILEFSETRDVLAERESVLVNELFLKNPLVLNIILGGTGSYSYLGDKSIGGKIGGNVVANRLKYDNEYRERMRIVRSNSFKKSHKEGKFKYDNFTGKNHTEETKQKMREKANQRIGNKNSQYGTCWITNGSENKKISKTDDMPCGWKHGRCIVK